MIHEIKLTCENQEDRDRILEALEELAEETEIVFETETSERHR